MFQLQLLFGSIVTNGTALQLCRDTSLSQELHYCSQVNYDEQYRLRKATSPSSSWGVVDVELWMLCVSTPPSGNIGFGNVERQSRNSPPIAHTSHTVNLGSTLNCQRRSDTNKSVCRLFNRGLQCKFGKNCKYSHRCTKCNGNHPITNCRLNTQFVLRKC